VIGECPVCKKGKVHDIGAAFVCEHQPSKACNFRMGKVILQREIPTEQVLKLLETGKTDLIPKFISKKGRPFSAFLKLEGGKVGFEFEPRKPAAKKAVAPKKVAEAA
jgi:DNA topoisomerase-3